MKEIIESGVVPNTLTLSRMSSVIEERKKIARKILATKHLPKWFQFLENLLQQNTNSVYFVGNEF